MMFMVIEHFRGGDAVPVYCRFRDRGRLAPEGLRYVASVPVMSSADAVAAIAPRL